MTRRIATAAVASIAVAGVAGVAIAAPGQSAKPYKASLVANANAATAGVPTVKGKAQLVDGKKNNKVSLHVRNLAPGTTYLWHVHAGTCAATGAPVAGWTYRTQDATGNGTVTTDASGNGNTRGKSTTFNADPAGNSVNVHVAAATNGLAPGTIIACGDLTAAKGAGKGKAK